MKARILIWLVLSAVMSPAAARACAVCFSGDDDAVTHAFNWSVGFLLAAPYAIAGTIAACLVIAYRRAALKRAALDEEQMFWTQEESAK
jgi:hypothetical protein